MYSRPIRQPSFSSIPSLLDQKELVNFKWLSSLIEIKKFFDTYVFGNELDLDKYCLLVIVGGDRSIHEVANGMMNRKDKKKCPIAGIPNGSGDDYLNTIGVDNVAEALRYIVKG